MFAQTGSSNPLPVPAGDPAVVVESGPVVYDDAAADEEEEEEEETCVSAMDLLGSNGQSNTHSLLRSEQRPAAHRCSLIQHNTLQPRLQVQSQLPGLKFSSF